MEHIERAHPLGVTLGQVIVHCNHVYAVACQGVKEYRQGCHKGLTFTGSHLSNLTLMQYHTTEQLYIVMDHVPYGIVTAGYPVLLPQSLITVYDNKVMLGCQVTVKISCGYLNLLILCEAAGGILYYGKNIRKDLIQNHLIAVQDLLLKFIYLIEQRLSVFQFGLLDLGLKILNTFFLRYYKILYFLADCLCCCTQLIIGKFLILRVSCLDLLHPRLNLLDITGLLVSEQLTYKFIKSHYAVLCLLLLSISTQNPCRNAKLLFLQ